VAAPALVAIVSFDTGPTMVTVVLTADRVQSVLLLRSCGNSLRYGSAKSNIHKHGDHEHGGKGLGHGEVLRVDDRLDGGVG